MAISSRTKRALGLSVVAVAAISMAACGAGKKNSGNGSSAAGNSSASTGGSKPIIIGTTDPLVALDPAGSYDFGSLLLQTNFY